MPAAVAIALALLGGAGPVSAQDPEVLATVRGLALSDGPVQAVLKPSSGPMAARISALPGNRRLYLVLKGARAAAPPATFYRVYLGPPQGEPIGSVNFFNAEQNRPRDYSFDVTDRVRGLQAAGAFTDSVGVTIVPTAQPNSNAKPTIAEVALVAQ
jgi:hypothetical protein